MNSSTASTSFLCQPIETPRLILRSFTTEDIDALSAIYSDPVVMQYIGKGALTREETEETIRSAMHNWRQHGFGNWAVITKVGGKLIGRCGLNFLDNTDDVHTGFVLAKNYWGKGLGKEMSIAALQFGFEKLELDWIYAAARATNTSSRALLEKLGMSFVRDASYYGHAAIIYGISRKQFWLSGRDAPCVPAGGDAPPLLPKEGS